MRAYNVYVTQDENGQITGIYGSLKMAEAAKNPFCAVTKHEIKREVEPPRVNTKVPDNTTAPL